MKKTSSIILPQQDNNGEYYISYSQYTSWKGYNRDYIRGYFLKEERTSNPYAEFGNLVGGALEKNNFSMFTKEEQDFLLTIPRHDLFEHEIRIDMDGYYVKGFIDTCTKDFSIVDDYKTCDIQSKLAFYESDEYEQLDIYAYDIYMKTGKMPKKMNVHLIGRTGNSFKGEELKLSLDYHRVERKVSLEKSKAALENIHKTALEISECYKVFRLFLH